MHPWAIVECVILFQLASRITPYRAGGVSMSSSRSFDFLVVGSGIVGMTVALEINKRYSGASIAVLEKESAPGLHASGRNSGVMHSGIYYESKTVKAKVCSDGAQRMIEFALSEGIAVNRCGKVIVATTDEQLPTIERLMRNAKENKIAAERIDNQQLRDIEPYAASGPAAIFCPTTAVIDSGAVVERIKAKLEEKGVAFAFECAFERPKKRGTIITSKGPVSYGFLINCAGAYADRLANSFGLAGEYALVPFKGTYYKLSQRANLKIRANIYPVPDISMPFLGVHFTRVIDGDVYVGPTAIPALGRENYGALEGIDFTESVAIGSRLARMYLRNENNFRKLVHREVGRYRKKNYLAEACKLVPSLAEEDLVSCEKCGIRPQLVNKKTGRLEMDYLLLRTDDSLHVLNAISPAFTSSLAFAEMIVDTAARNDAGMVGFQSDATSEIASR